MQRKANSMDDIRIDDYYRYETERLLLRPLTLDDAPRIERLAGDKLVAASTLNMPYPYEREMAEDFVHATRTDLNKRHGFVLCIADKTTNDLLGCIGLTPAYRHDAAELGYWMGVPYWGKGYTTEAARRMIQFGFEEVKLNRVFALCFSDNPASARVLEKSGMKHEGVLRQHLKKWDEYKDAVYYGILQSEWFAG